MASVEQVTLRSSGIDAVVRPAYGRSPPSTLPGPLAWIDPDASLQLPITLQFAT